MIVASWSEAMASIRASTAPGSPWRYSRPSIRSWSKVSVHSSVSGVPSRRMTRPTAGIRSRTERTFSSCSAFSAKTTRAPESERMNATSSAIVVG